MYLICIESSKKRGMGHLFRALLYTSYLKKERIPFLILINNDSRSIEILEKKGLPYIIADYGDETDWETEVIQRYGVKVWLEDKFETTEIMIKHIVANDSVLFCMVDEFGDSASYADIHFGGMLYLTGGTVTGKKIYCGSEYVILNPEIDRYKRIRNNISNIIVTLGGSDPFGATVDVVKELANTEYNVEVVIGPNFDYREELDEINKKKYPIKQNLPSLISEFSKFDFAITGGGITCCEANASGLPCMVIANAPHEIHTGRYIERKGGGIYAGSYDDWDRSRILAIQEMDIAQMSRKGMESFDTGALKRMFTIIGQEMKDEGRQIL